MTYTPFPIVDYRTGLFNAKDAWISPPDAFHELKNANIYRGRVVKRKGVEFFGFFPHRLDDADGAALTLTWGNSGSLIKVTTSAAHGLSSGAFVYFDGTSGTHSSQVEDKFFFITVVDTTNFTLDHSSQAGVSISTGQCYVIPSVTKVGDITAITNDDPCQVTVSSHGLSDSDRVILLSEENNAFSGLTSLNKAITTVEVNSPNTMLLNEIDSTNMGTYSSGGAVGKFNTTYPITGLGELFRKESDNILIACDVNRAAYWSPATSSFIPLPRVQKYTAGSLTDSSGLDDPFTGTETDLFQLTNAFNKLWFTNFKDRIYTYDGTDFVLETFELSGTGGAAVDNANNGVDRCKLIFQYNRRLIMLYTVESGTKWAQRVRWSRIDYGTGDTSQWDDTAADTTAGSLDADTDEEIITAGFLKDTLVVFFERSIWALRKTGSFDPPFRWEKLASHTGIFGSRFGFMSHDQFAWAFSSGGLIATDGVQIRRADDLIPEFEEEVDDNNYKRIYMAKTISQRETWIAYSTESDSSNDRVKVLDYENGTWAEYIIPYNVMTEFTVGDAADVTWADLNEIPDDLWQNKNVTWESFFSAFGLPENLIGDSYGVIKKINAGSSDQKRKIELFLQTGRLNPFKMEGQSASLGYVDFLFNENAATTVTIQFFCDFDSVPYVEQTVSLDSEDNVDTMGKVWKRVYVDSIANEHRIEISHNEAGQPFELHAMVPYFRPAGRFLFR